MRFGSVCSGIEAASVAFGPLGWKAAWLSEIEPFPCAVLAHHYPEVPNLGDMTTIAARIDAGEVEAPDMLCGGTPCQAFSVAGLRRSLDDARGNLSLEFIRIADAIDRVRRAAGKQPAWVLWENVPGVLSTRDNAFGAFLGGLCGCDAALDAPADGWPSAGVVAGPSRVVAWRVLDAQFFGVAQRRKRVFVLALGGAGAWACADALLPVGDRMRWHPAPSREAGKGVAGSVVARTGRNGGSSNLDVDGGMLAFGGNNTGGAIDVAAGLNAKGGAGRMDFDSETFVTHSLRGEGFDASEDGTGRGTPLVPVAFDTYNQVETGDVTQTLCSRGDSPGGNAHLVSAICFSAKDHGADAHEDLAPTLRAGGHAGSHANAAVMPAVAFQERGGRADGRRVEVGGDLAYALTAPKDGGRAQERNVLTPAMQVRRLTPRECEALQGFPPDYSLIPYRGKPAADGPRYKALGNSWAVPCVSWIGRRIDAVKRLADDTMQLEGEGA